MKSDIMRLECRDPIHVADDLENFMRIFLLDSFESKFVYIISPWISAFKFTRKIIYYPFVSSYDVVDVLKALHSQGVEIHVLARCFDDFLSPDLIYILYMIYNKNVSIPRDILLYLKHQLEGILRRLEMAEKIIDIGVNFKTDFVSSQRPWYRLHAKIYVNEKWALIGSANFSYGGIVSNGNWECLLMVDSKDKLYNEIFSHAKKLFSIGISYNECKERIVNLMNKHLRKYNVPIDSFDNLKIMLRELYRSL